ncbi:MAG: isochorismatase hydrolase, nicotinamidase/pyrazinamidase [Candidatus Saccharibacteria bacterium]|nr:isochorismatase hydrolase, nicotinamidase/pyrazinamidase [Candidatus Saccharibacteria bacterium]
MNQTAIGLIDVQRGFMPAEEGQRLETHGFGELPVPEGEQVIPALNRLVGAYAAAGAGVFTTQDWHPHVTAHFSDQPNFTTTWPKHCVDGTPGAELHPGLVLPGRHIRFIKGFEPLERGEDDLSYSGYYAEDPTTGHSLPDWLTARDIKTVILGGLALDYCVGETALDLRQKLGLEVIVALDGTRGIAEDSNASMLARFEEAGVLLSTTEALVNQLEAQAA